jgi:hypothetical protein
VFGTARGLGLQTAVGLTLPIGIKNTWQPGRAARGGRANVTANHTNVDMYEGALVRLLRLGNAPDYCPRRLRAAKSCKLAHHLH